MKLSEVIPWGRSFDEYRLMFGLSETDLADRFLGCGDGPASFNAEATARGHSVISCDPIYAFPAEDIRQRVEDTHETVISQVRMNPKAYVWNYFHDPDHLGQCRLTTVRRFLEDFEKGKAEGRYLTASLPSLPFENGQFSIALCSHFLFLYSDLLSFDFHQASIEELLRVALEVRLFPLVSLDAKPSPHLEPLMTFLADKGWLTEICSVAYEFLQGGNRMLRIRRSDHPPLFAASSESVESAACHIISS